MEKIRTNNKILKIGTLLLAFSILFSSFLRIAPLAVSATETAQAGDVVKAAQDPVSYYPQGEMPEYVLGKVFLGTEGLTDPVAKQYSNNELGVSGTYYEPTAYVYFGSYYDSATDRNIPLVHRVLDADADNAGNGGAIFVFSEFAGEYKTMFAHLGAVDYRSDDNIYSSGRISDSDVINYSAGVNYGSKYKNIYSNIPAPKDYIRQITKSDVHAEMQGLFGFYDDVGQSSLRWDVNVAGEYHGLDAESAQYLTNATYFPLSAKELNDYVSTVPYSPGLAVKYINSNEYATYWLRTGLEATVVGGDVQYIGEHDENEKGNEAGAVTPSGLVTALNTSEEAAIRYGFNIETGDIAFTQILENNTHRLAFIEPLYKDTDTPFEAELIDIKDNVVTVRYRNAILDGWYEPFVDDNYYLSVMIMDTDGNVTHYSSVHEMFGGYDDEPTEISDSEGTASFTLPAEYEYGDKVYVFWERKNEYMPEAISHVSNMVDLGCIHVCKTEATCTDIATCEKCGEAYGEIDPENHPHTNIHKYYFDSNGDMHWNVCPECNEKVNIENCTFGSSCTEACVCTNINPDNSIHDFDENGVCKNNREHFEIPEVSLSEGTLYGNVHIYNEGQLISFAKLQNSGAMMRYQTPYHMSLYIESDLDFALIEGYEPIGTTEYPFYGAVYGQKHTIKGISYSSSENENVGLFGVGDLDVYSLNVTECSFEGKDNVGVVLGQSIRGRSYSFSYFSQMDITDCTVNAINEDGNEGIAMGVALGDDTLHDIYSYNVTNGDGEYIRLAPNEEVLDISQSVYIYYESGEVARTAEQYASGQVAHEQGMRQFLGDGEQAGDPAPTNDTSKPKVGRVSYCDGDLAYYTNERLSVHLPMDRTIHEPTKFYEFIWDGSFAQASVYCGACHQDVLVTVDVEVDYSYVPVRGDYTARITVGDQTYEETITLIGIRIEEMIGMTYIVKDFDGFSVNPEDMMNNHRLNDGSDIPVDREYEVYFIDASTGEKLVETYTDSVSGMWVEKERALDVSKAGTYDLLVVGKNDYEGQEYIYKGALVINPVTVTVTPEDVYKYYDGNAKFTPEVTLDREGYEDAIEIEYSNADSAKVGDYVLDVTLKITNNEYEGNVKYVLSKDTVMGYIFPEYNVTLENKSYPATFNYGETVATPTEDHFNFTEGATLSFEWFKAEMYKYMFEVAPNKFETQYEILSMSRIYEMPKDAGDYILRVIATHTDNMVGDYIEIPVEILPKQLSFEIVAPDGQQPVVDEYDRSFYYLDMGEKLIPKVGGLSEGETLESAGVEISIYQYSAEGSGSNLPDVNNRYDFPTQPNMTNYWVWYNFNCSNKNYTFGESNSEAVYVRINDADAPTPVLDQSYIDDGEAKEVGVVFSWNAPETDDLSKVVYSITIKHEGKQIGYHVREGLSAESSLSLTQPVSLAGNYTVEITTRINNETVGTQNINFSVSFYKGGEQLDSIKEMGEYTVRVTSDGNVTREIDLAVKREIVLSFKENDYFITEGAAIYDATDVVMEAGKVILLGHELSDVDIYINDYMGTATVNSITVKDANGNDVSHLYSVTSRTESHSDGGLGVVHIYDSPCDTDCNIYGCENTRIAAHTGGIASCTSLAICDVCNMEYGSYATHRHTCDHTHLTPNPDDLMTHLVIHSCCGLTKEVKGHTPKTVATCTDRAVCADCGWKYGDINPNNHTSEEFTYKPSAEDGAKHIKKRVCCGEEMLEEHTGGSATCSALAKCEYCFAGYGEFDPDNHAGEIAYTPDANNGSIHSAHCLDCDSTWTEEHRGGEATCSTLAVCEACKASYGELDADNHETEDTKYVVRAENPSMHDHLHSCCNAFISKAYHSGGQANCASAALCEFCDEAYGQKDPANHASDEFKYTQSAVDVNAHVKHHKCCGVEIAVENHTGADTATCEHPNICGICGIGYGEKLEHVYDNACDSECNICQKLTRPYTFHIDENNDHKCDNCSVDVDGNTSGTENEASDSAVATTASAVATASVVVLGSGGFSLFWFVIKKKSLAELLRLLIG